MNSAPKKAALKSLVKAMTSMRLEKIKGYKSKDDEVPVVVAKAHKKKKTKEEEDED